MFTQLVARSGDLQRLVNEGYELSIEAGKLAVGHVPYLDGDGAVQIGTLFCELTTDGGATVRPLDHTMHFTGVPHDDQKRPLDKVINSTVDVTFGSLRARTYLSSKPDTGYYPDYHAKVSSYVRMIAPWAQKVDPSATALTFAAIVDTGRDSVFHYFDSATSRAGTSDLNRLLEGPIAIVGVGGSGSYVLDFIAKTPVSPIHLWDGDIFLAHNAFRAPGAATADQLLARPSKVDYLHHQYSGMRTGIVAHGEKLNASNARQMLKGMRFVFLCMDAGPDKREIVDALIALDVPFVDCGMAVARQQGKLAGLVRVTASLPDQRDEFGKWVSYSSTDEADEYGENIQIAELNALNAALAVITWKRWAGFYVERDAPLHSIFSIVGGRLTNTGPGIED